MMYELSVVLKDQAICKLTPPEGDSIILKAPKEMFVKNMVSTKKTTNKRLKNHSSHLKRSTNKRLKVYSSQLKKPANKNLKVYSSQSKKKVLNSNLKVYISQSSKPYIS